MGRRKGQAAMEFLMSYGWALIIFLIAISILYYIGFVNIKNLTRESCTMAPGIYCSDFMIDTNSIELLLVNTYSNEFTVENITVGSCQANFGYRMLPQIEYVFSMPCPVGNRGEIFKGDILITFRSEAGLIKYNKGNVVSIIQ